MPLHLPKHTPSWKQGFARSAAESRNPGLWKGLVGLWMPMLGPTGSTLFDLSGRCNESTFAGTLNPTEDWITTADGPAIRLTNSDNGDEYLTLPARANSQGQSEWSLVVRLSQTETTWVQRFWWDERHTGSYGQNVILYNSDVELLQWLTRDTSTGLTGSPDNNLSVVLANPFAVSAAFVYSPAQSLKAIYLDGELAGSTSTSVDPFNSSWTEIYGHMMSGLDGNCWQLLRYNRALAPHEVRQFHQDPLAIVRQKPKYYPPAPGAIKGSSTLEFTASAAIQAAGKPSGSTGLSFTASAAIHTAGELFGSTALDFTASAASQAAGRLSGSTALDFTASAASQAAGGLSGSTALGFTPRGDISDTLAVRGPYRVAAGVPYVAGSVAGQLWSPGSVSGAVHTACPVVGMVA